jgi:poly(beta-D-mannuronate) lyase
VVPISASSEGALIANTNADNAIDGDLSDSSYWSSSAQNASLTIDLGKQHQIKQVRIAWRDGDSNQYQFNLATSEDGTNFSALLSDVLSSGTTPLPDVYDHDAANGRYLRIETNFSNGQNAEVSEVLIYGCALDGSENQPNSTFSVSSLGLDPNAPPGSNFDLLTWALDTPADLDNNDRSDRTSETALANGFEDEFFFTGSDGGMVFRSTIAGAKTSANTSFTRSELREMLRRGNTSISTRGVNQNNWLLGYQPEVTNATGGRNGTLSASLAVNHVNETGSSSQLGRVIIGQIHAEDDEPIRLYYRKHPQSNFGYIYLAHELRGGDDTYRMVYGPEYNNFDSQPNFTTALDIGLALDDVFSYDIVQIGARIDVFIRAGGTGDTLIAHAFVDMEALNSAYDVADEWMYFKAGAYTQNNTGEQDDFDQVTFYSLSNSHD